MGERDRERERERERGTVLYSEEDRNPSTPYPVTRPLRDGELGRVQDEPVDHHDQRNVVVRAAGWCLGLA